MLPTPQININITNKILMAPGRVINGEDLKVLVLERMKTWQNPYNSTVEVRLTESLRPIET
eukprot:8082215-Karenia_brevis.AAC.1